MSKFFNKFNQSDSDVNTDIDIDTKDATPGTETYPELIQKTGVGTYSGLTIGSGLSVSGNILSAAATGVTRASVYIATASTITIPTNAKGMLVTLIGSGGSGGVSATAATAGVGGGGGAGGMTVLYLQNVQNYSAFSVTFNTGAGSSIDFAFSDSTPTTYKISAFNGADSSANIDTDTPSLGGAGGAVFNFPYTNNQDLQCYTVGGANGASGFIVPGTGQVYVSGAGAASIFGGAGVGAVALSDSAGVGAVAFGSGGSGSIVTGTAASLSPAGGGQSGFCLIEYIA